MRLAADVVGLLSFAVRPKMRRQSPQFVLPHVNVPSASLFRLKGLSRLTVKSPVLLVRRVARQVVIPLRRLSYETVRARTPIVLTNVVTITVRRRSIKGLVRP